METIEVTDSIYDQFINPRKEKKVKTSFRLHPRVKSLIASLSEELCMSQTSVVQMAVVKLAKAEDKSA